MQEVKLLKYEYLLMTYATKKGESSGIRKAINELDALIDVYIKSVDRPEFSDEEKKKTIEGLSIFKELSKKMVKAAEDLEKESAALLQKSIEVINRNKNADLFSRLKNAMIGFRQGLSKEN